MLSLLSNDVLSYIVEHLAALPYSDEAVRNLSLADRAFTPFCQKHIFETLQLGSKNPLKSNISYTLEKLANILREKPSFANHVRIVQLLIKEKQNAWIFNDSTFIHILEQLANSPRPPHNLYFGGIPYLPITIEDPIFVVWIMQSFFSRSLTTLQLNEWTNFPLPLLLACPNLRDVALDAVDVTDETYDNHPANQCSGREPPALERFEYRSSVSVVKQMITPPPRFQTPVVLWSKLCALTVCPYEKREMACLQPILDIARNTLEELHLTTLCGDAEQLPLSTLVDLKNLSRLRVFALLASIKGNARKSVVIRDINTVLGTIPASNQITNLLFDFIISGKHPFQCLDEDWPGLCDQIIRISAEKPIELDLLTTVNRSLDTPNGENDLYGSILEKTTVFSEYPKICTHSWNPTCWDRGLAPFPRGQVRNKCRR